MAAVILEILAKATLLLAAGSLLALAARRASAALRHLLWCATLFCCLVLPLMVIVLPQWHVLPAWFEVPATPSASTGAGQNPAPTSAIPSPSPPESSPGNSAGQPSAAPERSPIADVASVPPALSPSRSIENQKSKINNRDPLLLSLYLIGVLAVLLPLLLAAFSLARLKKSAVPLSAAHVHALFRARAAELGLKGAVGLLESPHSTMPMTWGIFRPVILLPQNAGEWPADRLRCVLLHELAHIRRRDTLTLFFARIACALYWFHPLAWVAAARLRSTAEHACDDLVLSRGTKSSAYSELLLALAGSPGRPFPRVAAIAMAHRRSLVQARIAAILNPAQNRKSLNLVTLAAILAIASLLLIPLACASQRTTTAAAPTPPLAATSVSATLPNGVTVELRAINHSSGSRETWYSPASGAPFPAPYDSLDANFRDVPADQLPTVRNFISSIRSSPQFCEFAFRFHDLDQNDQPQFAIDGEPGLAAYPAVYAWPNRAGNWWQYTTLLAAPTASHPDGAITLRIHIASGPFTDGPSLPLDHLGSVTLDGSPVLLEKPQNLDGFARFSIEFDPRIHDVCIVAVARDGRQFPNAGNLFNQSGPADDPAHPGFHREILGLAQLRFADIDRLVVRSRPVETAIFSNVPIRNGGNGGTGAPGILTAVSVPTSGPAIVGQIPDYPHAGPVSSPWPDFAEFQKLLNQPIDSPAVQVFTKRFDMGKYYKFDEGGFENYEHVPFSLLYRQNRISRIIFTVPRSAAGDFSDAPVYTGALPSGVQPTDSPDDLLRRMGKPDSQNGDDSFVYKKPGLTFSFDPDTHKLLEIDLDAPPLPQTQPAPQPAAIPSNPDDLPNGPGRPVPENDTDPLIHAIDLPKGWKVHFAQGAVGPYGLKPGNGFQFDFAPDPLPAGKYVPVTLWLMDKDYPATEAPPPPPGAPQTPLAFKPLELFRWNGRRVFLYAYDDQWPKAESIIAAALEKTDTIPWGDPASGVQLRLEPAYSAWPARDGFPVSAEHPALNLDARETGKPSAPAGALPGIHAYDSYKIEIDGKIYFNTRTINNALYNPPPDTDPTANRSFILGPFWQSNAGQLKLPAGKHTVRAVFGQAYSNPVTLTILPDTPATKP